MTREEKKLAFMRILSRYMPGEAVAWSAEFILKHAVKMKITRVRSSKLGDYRHPFGREGHQITINHDLNPIAFLVTFVHEAAHLETWNKHKNSVSPHGKEWQSEFARLIREIIELSAFPEELVHHFLSRGDSLSASSCSDKELNRLLRKYDPPKGTVLLEELPDQVHFQLSTGEVFQKGQKQRTRYRCLHVQKNKWYLVSGQAEVKLWNK
jgi:SprT protein